MVVLLLLHVAAVMPSSSSKKTFTINFRFLVIASGKNVPIEGFDRRSLDAKLSIAVTANFANNHTPEEAEVRQISGIAKHFHQVIKEGIPYVFLCRVEFK